GLQALIFAFVLLERSSTVYLLGPIMLAALFRIWVNRRSPDEVRQILAKIGLTLAAGMALSSIISASVPDYVKTGRFLGGVWHRALGSLSYHPDWPFGNLRETYDCTNVIPKGLDVGRGNDQNAHCIFSSSYPPALSGELSNEEIDAHLYDGVYEKQLRSA